MKYHKRLSRKYENEGNKKLAFFHEAMYARLNYASNLPTFSKYREGYKAFGKEYTKEEYLQMSNDDKRKYHTRMKHRARKSGNIDLYKWYQKMQTRLDRGSKLPTYYSPEHEAEESQ